MSILPIGQNDSRVYDAGFIPASVIGFGGGDDDLLDQNELIALFGDKLDLKIPKEMRSVNAQGKTLKTVKNPIKEDSNVSTRRGLVKILKNPNLKW